MSAMTFFEERKTGVVRVHDETGRLLGGGAFINVGSQKLILTAAHVIHNKSGMNVFCSNGDQYRVQQEYISRTFDLGLLRVVNMNNTTALQCLRLSEVDVTSDSRVHLIGHPGHQIYSHNIGEVLSVNRTCGNIYFDDLGLSRLGGQPNFNRTPNPNLIDDFIGINSDVRLVQAKNIHGGGRMGGTGAPFFGENGDIVGVYSFTYKESDYAIHVSVVRQMISDFQAA